MNYDKEFIAESYSILDESTETLKSVDDKTFAMLMNSTDIEQEDTFDQRKICNLDCFSDSTSELKSSVEQFQNEKDTSTTTEISETSTTTTTSTTDCFRFATELIIRIDSMLQMLPISFEQQKNRVQIYIQKKTQKLLSQQCDYANNPPRVNQKSIDYFPADEQTIKLFHSFFKSSCNILWTKVNNLCHICRICKCVIKYRTSLYDHLNIHYEHYHVCTICSQKFASLKALKKHNRMHRKLLE